MEKITIVEGKGTSGVKKLRERKLRMGQPFMINSKELPTYQCYLEFPGGAIYLMETHQMERELKQVKLLSLPEANEIRVKYAFSPVS